MATHDKSIISGLAEYSSAEAAISSHLYHGSISKIEGDLRPGSYDGIFWCAQSPAIAQTYIPASGIVSYWAVERFTQNERLSPSKDGTSVMILRAMGFTDAEFDVHYDVHGRIQSYRILDGHPTNAEAADWLHLNMGYPAYDRAKSSSQTYGLKTTFDGDTQIILPADYKAPGTLVIVKGADTLRWKDFTVGREGDLMMPDYHRHDWFMDAAEQGYDGVIIHDFCQSKKHGNVGHISWGLLPATGLKKVSYICVPAVNFDWPDETVFHSNTPDFQAAYDAALTKNLSLTRSSMAMSI